MAKEYEISALLKCNILFPANKNPIAMTGFLFAYPGN
jgi:hypothetical protein